LFSYLLRGGAVAVVAAVKRAVSWWCGRSPRGSWDRCPGLACCCCGLVRWFPLYLLGNKELVCFFLLTIIFLCYVAVFTPVIFTISTKRWHSTSCGIEIFWTFCQMTVHAVTGRTKTMLAELNWRRGQTHGAWWAPLWRPSPEICFSWKIY
jgi:hypothetical protein